MKDDTAPVTAKQFEQLLQTALQPIKDQMDTFAIKDDLKEFATKQDLADIRLEMATKKDIRALELAMKQESQWVRDRLEWLRQGIDQALVIFGNADGERKSEIINHERRLKRLEKKVGLAATV